MNTRPGIASSSASGYGPPFRRSVLLGFCLAFVSLAPAVEAAGDVAHTTYGDVRGQYVGRVLIFKGIPYGDDTAKTRFQRAAPPAAWPGVRDALNYGASCPQDSRPVTGPRKLLQSWTVPEEQSEDCLFLNVWTPALDDGAKRPVMVWLHGGGFANGSGAASVYDGSRLVEKGDVVVVSLNHRLNIFGYLYLGEYSAEFADSGNVGQHDLVAALKWVRDNIRAFGGDPENVTIFGESGGGAKVSTLLAMEEAQGLFHRAIIQSGPMPWAATEPSARQTAALAVESLGLKEVTPAAVAKLTTSELLETLAYIKQAGRFRTLAPVVDGRGLKGHPFDPDAPAVSADIPLMIGFTAAEATLLLGFDESLFTLGWADLPGKLAPHVGKNEAAAIVRDYRVLYPEASPSDVFFKVTTQVLMIRNALHIADLKAAQARAPVYAYALVFETAVDGGKWRTPHAMDIPLVFDNLAYSTSMFGDTPNVQKVADQMSSAWLAFARSGNPNTPELPAWPAYDRRRAIMQFDVKSVVEFNPTQAEMDILQAVPLWDMTQPQKF